MAYDKSGNKGTGIRQTLKARVWEKEEVADYDFGDAFEVASFSSDDDFEALLRLEESGEIVTYGSGHFGTIGPDGMTDEDRKACKLPNP